MKAHIIGVLLVLSSPVAMAGVSADDFYTALKRGVDTAEGHILRPDAAADLDMAEAMGYVGGMWDGMKLEAEARRPGSSACMAAPIQVAGMVRIVLRYVDSHPNAHSGDRFSVVGSAYRDAYPCLR